MSGYPPCPNSAGNPLPPVHGASPATPAASAVPAPVLPAVSPGMAALFQVQNEAQSLGGRIAAISIGEIRSGLVHRLTTARAGLDAAIGMTTSHDRADAIRRSMTELRLISDEIARESPPPAGHPAIHHLRETLASPDQPRLGRTYTFEIPSTHASASVRVVFSERTGLSGESHNRDSGGWPLPLAEGRIGNSRYEAEIRRSSDGRVFVQLSTLRDFNGELELRVGGESVPLGRVRSSPPVSAEELIDRLNRSHPLPPRLPAIRSRPSTASGRPAVITPMPSAPPPRPSPMPPPAPDVSVVPQPDFSVAPPPVARPSTDLPLKPPGSSPAPAEPRRELELEIQRIVQRCGAVPARNPAFGWVVANQRILPNFRRDHRFDCYVRINPDNPRQIQFSLGTGNGGPGTEVAGFRPGQGVRVSSDFYNVFNWQDHQIPYTINSGAPVRLDADRFESDFPTLYRGCMAPHEAMLDSLHRAQKRIDTAERSARAAPAKK